MEMVAYNMKMKIAKISGFNEYLPNERIVEREIINLIDNVFKLCGFLDIQMRSVEQISSLLAKGETSKEVYLLSRLQNPNIDLNSNKQLGLHFDLTIPFARYVLQNSGKLLFPFRRSSIGKVWRGERPQNGRFREFTQADIDIVSVCENNMSVFDALPVKNDIEIVRVINTALEKIWHYTNLNQTKSFKIHINNRAFLQSAYEIIGIKDYQETLRTVDKLDKIGSEEVLSQLVLNGESEESAKKCLSIAKIITDDYADLECSLQSIFGSSFVKLDGLDVFKEFLDAKMPSVVVDLKIARGLDYYTGTVFESFIEGESSFGSIASGGRYDNLVSQIDSSNKKQYPGVGMSIGVSRLLSYILDNTDIAQNAKSPTDALVIVHSNESAQLSQKVVNLLRENGISCYVSPIASKYGKQIDFAAKRGVKYVVFPPEIGDDSQNDMSKFINIDTDEMLNLQLSVKNIDTGTQKDVILKELNNENIRTIV